MLVTAQIPNYVKIKVYSLKSKHNNGLYGALLALYYLYYLIDTYFAKLLQMMGTVCLSLNTLNTIVNTRLVYRKLLYVKQIR